MQQLVNGIGIIRRHLFPDLGPGVLGTDHPADGDKPVNGNLLVLMKHLLRNRVVMPVTAYDFPGIIDKIGQLQLVRFGHHIAKGLLDLGSDDT